MTSESPLVVEPRRRSNKPHSPAPKSRAILRPTDILFLNAYLSNGQNGTHAYKSIHPKASLESCRAAAPRLLARAPVRSELQRRLRESVRITSDLVDQDLLTARELALEKRDPLVIASVAMDMAKKGGMLVERRESKDVTDTAQPAIRSLVDAALTQTPTLPPTNVS